MLTVSSRREFGPIASASEVPLILASTWPPPAEHARRRIVCWLARLSRLGESALFSRPGATMLT